MNDPTLGAVSTETAIETETEQVIAQRRTSLLVDTEAEVARSLVADLIEAAGWAPNHKRTWPWRFTVLTGNSRAVLGEAMAMVADGAGLPEPKVAKLRTKYLRSPTVLLVWHERHTDDEVRCREDRDAVAAATQNLLLAATARGLASFWGTVPDVLMPAVRIVADVDDQHDLIALIYLGWPIGTVPPPERPAPQVTWLT